MNIKNICVWGGLGVGVGGGGGGGWGVGGIITVAELRSTENARCTITLH